MWMRGYKYDEIADAHDVGVSQVKAQIYAARQELKKLIEGF